MTTSCSWTRAACAGEIILLSCLCRVTLNLTCCIIAHPPTFQHIRRIIRNDYFMFLNFRDICRHGPDILFVCLIRDSESLKAQSCIMATLLHHKRIIRNEHRFRAHVPCAGSAVELPSSCSHMIFYQGWWQPFRVSLQKLSS